MQSFEVFGGFAEVGCAIDTDILFEDVLNVGLHGGEERVFPVFVLWNEDAGVANGRIHDGGNAEEHCGIGAFEEAWWCNCHIILEYLVAVCWLLIG